MNSIALTANLVEAPVISAVEEVQQIMLALEAARSRFDEVTEDERIEAAIYELKSLELRLDCAMRRLRREA